MKNSKGISLIALIITIIVIIILAAIVIGGVFNTPNDAKFANFCQEYDRVQTAIQLRYYELYQKYAINPLLTEIPTHYQIYYEVASGIAPVNNDGTANASYAYKSGTGTGATDYKDTSRWVEITNWGTGSNNICKQPENLDGWYLRTHDGKLAYNGFEKEEKVMYFTPSVFIDNHTESGAAGRQHVAATATGADLATTANTTDLNSVTTSDANLKTLAK